MLFELLLKHYLNRWCNKVLGSCLKCVLVNVKKKLFLKVTNKLSLVKQKTVSVLNLVHIDKTISGSFFYINMLTFLWQNGMFGKRFKHTLVSWVYKLNGISRNY